MKKTRKAALICAGSMAVAISICVFCPQRAVAQADVAQFLAGLKNGSTPAAGSLKDSVPPYDKVVTKDAITSKGFIWVHKINDKYLFELPDSIFGRDLMSVNRLARSPQDWTAPFGVGGEGVDWIGNSIFCFSKDKNNKVILKVKGSYTHTAEGSMGISGSLARNSEQPIAAVFPIRAYGKDSASVVIDMTAFLTGDNTVFGYHQGFKGLMMPLPMSPDKSYLSDVRALPTNIEIRSVKTFSSETGTASHTMTGEFNSSVIILSKEPMRGRNFDSRVGYLAVAFADYEELNAYGNRKENSYIWRWRLEPRPQDLNKYYQGELVEPVKPIIFFIDPATPKKWVPYLIAGVNDWQKAMEKAGFKNAVMAKEVDPQDTTFDIDAANRNVIVYKASSVANAMGHTVIDPRSGEIVESHIQWYHSVMEVLYKWYLTQAGAVDTAAQKPQISDELMGKLIRFVSSHEVGHALGLRHNWGASSTTPVEKLRDKEWLKIHGHTPSIMDYARFNYVAQPEDQLNEEEIFPRIGDADIWAIEWGYRLLPRNTSADKETKLLNQWVIDKLKTGRSFSFGIGDDPSVPYPANQREDLGDDAMRAGSYGIKNLKRIRENLVKWVQAPGESYNKLESAYKALVAQYEWYTRHVIGNLGGLDYTPKTSEQPGAVYESRPIEKQQRAIAFLNAELFTTPLWLQDDFIYNVTSTNFSEVEKVQQGAIKTLLDFKLFDKLRTQELADPSSYTLNDMLTDLENGIFSELKTGAYITNNRRFVQNIYINELLQLLSSSGKLNHGDEMILKYHTKLLTGICKNAASARPDDLEKIHLENLSAKLYNAVIAPVIAVQRRLE